MHKKIGKFLIHVSDPSPIWIRLEMEGRRGTWALGLDDVDDLIYGLQKAKEAGIRKLKEVEDMAKRT